MATEQAPRSWLETRLPIGAAWRATVTEHRSAREQPYLATLPGLILGLLIFLAVSGTVLSLYYVAQGGDAFASLQVIIRSVNFGWLIHGFHASATTLIFALVYLLLFRGLLTSTHKGAHDLAWFLTVTLFIVLLATGWLGYVMTDGAVARWSLQSATRSAARFAGLPGAIGGWIFGGPATPGTLIRMAAFHVLLALVVVGLIGGIIAANRVAAGAPRRAVAFHPYYTGQYFAAFVLLALVLVVLTFFLPHLGENRLNLAAPDPLIVPVAIAPPWYLGPFSAIAAAMPGAGGGIAAVIAALAMLYLLPWLDRTPPGLPTRLLYRLFVWLLAVDVIALGILGAAPAGAEVSALGVICTVWYFVHFLIITPLTTGAA